MLGVCIAIRMGYWTGHIEGTSAYEVFICLQYLRPLLWV
jgi:hypothetical protein